MFQYYAFWREKTSSNSSCNFNNALYLKELLLLLQLHFVLCLVGGVGGPANTV